MWTVWNKKDKINGFSAEWFLNRHKDLQTEETIFLKWENDRVIWVMAKSVLADHYGIDPTLPNDEFIAEYERIISEPITEEVIE
jgi:hypothetical protein